MQSKKEKKQIVQNIIAFMKASEYDPLALARYTYLLSLDEKTHRCNDTQLYELMYTLSGMDAGAEFTLTEDEVLEMLRVYLLSIE